MFKSFAKSLFGVKYERIRKNILIFIIVFWGLHIADFQIQIAPSILYLMASTFTAGVMCQALCSEDNNTNMTNLFMLPFEDWKLIFSYVSALGAYILITKTGLLLAVVFAVSSWNASAIVGSMLCTMNAVIMAACVFSFKKYRVIGLLWAGIIIAVIFLENSSSVLLAMLTGNILLGIRFLKCLDAYSFYRKAEVRHRLKKTRHYSVLRYLFRYLVAHKNYMINTVIMWGVACILPMFFIRIGTLFALPVGFAILSLNTPICILLSCDPALEQAVHFLPGQKKAFCIPYCLFIFLCNMPADIIFLFSWEIQIGNITIYAVLISIFFALQSSIASVLLEWFCPIRGWKIESDLWHHPRKYVVPVAMFLIAGVVGTLSWLACVLVVLLLLEVAILLFQCRRY
jgi:hypothetical protein